jgi:pimeloyl-ACP methyl ester carboxylesterase
MSEFQRAAWRGEKIDIGGRSLRVVPSGPQNSGPTIVLEHGAFGCAADWAVVQERLAARGLRSVAYDRAGLGHSDPGPSPRDGRAIVADLEHLLRRLDAPGPYILVGHSMGGLMVRLFALTYPERAAGVVLVDAVTPDIMTIKGGARAVRSYGRALRLVSHAAGLGLMKPVAAIAGDHIGLSGPPAVEKRRIYGMATHARWAALEVAEWPATSQQASDAEFPPELPIAVVTAGAERKARWLKAIQVSPARASRHGYVEHVAGAKHASLLGESFADPIIRGIEHVLRAVRA